MSKLDRNFQQLPQWCVVILCFCSLIMIHFYHHHIAEVKRFPCKYDAQLPVLTLQNAEGGPPSTLIWDVALLFVNALPESKGGSAPIQVASIHWYVKTIGRRFASWFAGNRPLGDLWSMLQPMITSFARFFLGALELCWNTVDSASESQPPLQCLMMQSCHLSSKNGHKLWVPKSWRIGIKNRHSPQRLARWVLISPKKKGTMSAHCHKVLAHALALCKHTE